LLIVASYLVEASCLFNLFKLCTLYCLFTDVDLSTYNEEKQSFSIVLVACSVLLSVLVSIYRFLFCLLVTLAKMAYYLSTLLRVLLYVLLLVAS
jgi:hypothetical protein